MIFQMFKEVYKDIDRLRKAQQKYLNLKQDFKKKFASFYNKFICNNRLLKYLNKILMNNLMFKLNKSFRSALINNFRSFNLII